MKSSNKKLYGLCLVTYPSTNLGNKQFTKGKLYSVFEFDNHWVRIKEDDSKRQNGWMRKYFIILSNKNQIKLANLLFL